jgi:hypothetical protein
MWSWDPGSGIRDPGSGIRDPRSGIRKKPIPDPGSRGQQGTGSRIRIRNTGSWDGFFQKVQEQHVQKPMKSQGQEIREWFNLHLLPRGPSSSLLCGSRTAFKTPQRIPNTACILWQCNE